MEKLFAMIVLALVLILGTVAATGWASQQAAQAEYARGQAEAAIVRAQGQASIDRAEAAQIRAEASVQQIEALAMAIAVGLLATAPLVVMLLVAVLGLGLMAVAITGLRSRPKVVYAPPQIITREIVYLPAPGQRRREVWQVVSETRPELVARPGREGRR
jgi:hypothetical protein